VLEAAPLPIALFAPSGTILRMNEAMRRLLGLEEKDVGAGQRNVLEDADSQASGDAARFRRALAGEGVHHERLIDRALPEKGEASRKGPLYAEEHLFPVLGEGEVVAVAAFLRDLTEKRWAEQERTALERRVQETQRLEALGMLAGGIAHD